MPGLNRFGPASTNAARSRICAALSIGRPPRQGAVDEARRPPHCSDGPVERMRSAAQSAAPSRSSAPRETVAEGILPCVSASPPVLHGHSSAVEPPSARHVVGHVGERDRGCRTGDANRADLQAHPLLLMGEDMLHFEDLRPLSRLVHNGIPRPRGYLW